MYNTIFNVHKVVVILFLLIYLIKTILLLTNKNEQLKKFSKTFRIPEMIVSFLFLATGIYMLIKAPEVSMLMVLKLVAVFASIPVAVIAYKKMNKGLAVLSLLLIVGAYGLAEVSKKKMGQGKEVAAGADGKALYDAKCTLCHGADGKLGSAGASDLSATDESADDIARIIKEGKNTMVPVVMSDEDAKAVAAYVLTLKK